LSENHQLFDHARCKWDQALKSVHPSKSIFGLQRQSLYAIHKALLCWPPDSFYLLDLSIDSCHFIPTALPAFKTFNCDLHPLSAASDAVKFQSPGKHYR